MGDNTPGLIVLAGLAAIVVGFLYFVRIGRQARAREVRIEKKMVSDYGYFLEHGGGGLFQEESVLPHPKEKILDAIEAEIVREPLDARVEALKTTAVILAGFQSGVGPKSLVMPGLSGDEFDALIKLGDVRASAKVIATASTAEAKAQFERLRKLYEADADHIMARMRHASERRKKWQRSVP